MSSSRGGRVEAICGDPETNICLQKEMSSHTGKGPLN